MPTTTAKRKLMQGSGSNLARMLLSMFVSLLLPPFLVHRMSPPEYSAWVLILQLSAYVSFLDFGLQTAIGKFVAEYDATGDLESSRALVSTALSMLMIASALSMVLVLVLVVRVPQLFHQMPAALVPSVRLGLFVVGASLALSLPFSVFLTAFTGLQQYAFPTVLLSVSRIGSAVTLVILLLRHGTLVEMSCVLSAFNLGTALLQYVGWKRYASARAPISFFHFHRHAWTKLVEYCGVLSLWTLGTLLMSGLDTTIVGHYDFANTGFYAVASSATNFTLLLIGNLLGPLLPAISSLQTGRTPERLGTFLVRITRYSTLLLCALCLPLLVAGYPLLTAWVGAAYARHSVLFLQVLILANMVRQLGYPYSLVVVATGKQRYASVTPVIEAAVNFAASIWLAHRVGAVGVALGTLIGSVFGISAHFLISMRWTQSTIAVSRLRLLREGLSRPLLCILPSLLLYPAWSRLKLLPMAPGWLLCWAFGTVAIAWFAGLQAHERSHILKVAARRVRA